VLASTLFNSIKDLEKSLYKEKLNIDDIVDILTESLSERGITFGEKLEAQEYLERELK